MNFVMARRLMPPDTPDHAAEAWLECFEKHITDDAIVAWLKETRCPCDAPDEVAQASFIDWFNRRIWGAWLGAVGNA